MHVTDALYAVLAKLVVAVQNSAQLPTSKCQMWVSLQPTAKSRRDQ